MNTKQLKKDLWKAYYTATDAGASRKVTNAILDVMVIADKESAEKDDTPQPPALGYSIGQI